MAHNVDLVASYWTVAGSWPGTDREFSRFGFRERVAAVARAGFMGMGFWHADLEHVMADTSLADMKAILDDHGISHVEVEFLLDWFLEGEPKRESDRRKRLLFTAAEGLGASYIKVGDFHNRICPMPRLIEAFAGLCREAAEIGTRIAFEPMASAMICSLKDSLAMVEGAGAVNGGLAIDIYHMVNQAESLAELAALPVSRLFAVEINDAEILKPGGHNRHAGDPRRFCGEGDFDIRGFIAAVHRTGYSGAWGVEVIARELLEMELDAIATKAYGTARAQFD